MNEWSTYRKLWIINRFYKRITKKRLKSKFHYKEVPLEIEETNQKIRDLIMSNKPFMVGRFGNTELQTMAVYQEECKNRKLREKYKAKIVRNSGFFYSSEDEIYEFVKLMEISCKQIDLLGVWYIEMEDYFINKFCRHEIELGKLPGLEPWYSSIHPWSELLIGKRVVFVHPFKNTIEHQLEYRDKLFSNRNVLPECDIRVVQAVQTLVDNKDDRFCTWFEALEYMFKEVMINDFDIAIIGCGAYGFPLAAKIKQAGKMAIHLGGATQLFFGIKGKRWDNHPVISKLYNEYWTYPLESDRPKGFEKVEKGCYW